MSKLGDSVVPNPKITNAPPFSESERGTRRSRCARRACAAPSHRVAPPCPSPRASSRGARTDFCFYNTETLS
ncbi:hypothetical protein GNZ24_18800 [Burkholderia thailandensis]|nr:hypothetical protein A8H31_23990 [Burkholderia thailandensis]MUV21583.1 hypothetical protein [Burkholderia thailandensis]MUV29024.1 hypothetical protein [Burkholderia thailandensis]NBC93059.1 hypothetical protein [Burkholderia thailandensis]NOK55320.1 hypothetical protein [Burkholderia thailandensis]